MVRRFALACAALVLAPLLGCQVISASITSPSDWVSGTGESVSGSLGGLSRSSGSGGGGSTASLAYQRDVRAFTAHFARNGGSADDFLRGVGTVAALHGVSHWEALAETHRAIGAGLRDGGVDGAGLEALATAANADPEAHAALRDGYAAAR
jgi:hypothetical protein